MANNGFENDNERGLNATGQIVRKTAVKGCWRWVEKMER